MQKFGSQTRISKGKTNQHQVNLQKMANFDPYGFYLQIIYTFNPDKSNCEQLINIFQQYQQKQITDSELDALLQQFNDFMQQIHQKQEDFCTIEYQDFLSIVKLTKLNIDVCRQILSSYMLVSIPVEEQNKIQSIYQLIQTLTKNANPSYITQDDILILLLSLLHKNEINTFQELTQLAQQVLVELNCYKGLIPVEALILYLYKQNLNVSEIREENLKIGQIQQQLKSLQSILDAEIEDKKIIALLYNNPEIYQLRFGIESVNQQLISQLIQYLKQRIQLQKEQQIQSELISCFLQYEKQYQEILDGTIVIESIQKTQLQKDIEKTAQQQFTAEIESDDEDIINLNVDEMITRAEWVEIGKDQEIKQMVNSLAPAENKQQDLQNSDSELSYDNHVSSTVKQDTPPIPVKQSQQLQQTQRKFNPNDDDCVKKMKKVLNGLK